MVHASNERFEFDDLAEALQKGMQVTKESAVKVIEEQNLEISYITYVCRDMYLADELIIYKEITVQEDGTVLNENDQEYGKYLETQIKVLVGGKIFASV